MLKETSKDFRAFFLLQLARELVEQSYLQNKDKIDEINTLHRVTKKDVRTKLLPKEKKLNDKEFVNVLSKPLQNPKPVKQFKQRKAKLVLRIPEPRLPPALNYLTPSPTNQQIDLEKLNPLIQDPLVNAIECNGPDQQLVVKGKMGTKKTNIILNEGEIGETIRRFSETAKIPVHEGVFKVALGKLILSAIVSQVVGTKFVIKKMSMYAPKY